MAREISRRRYVSPDELHVVSSVGWLLRALGIPFILFACYLFSILLSSLGEYIANANPAEWLAALPGMVILGLLGLLFLAPGWLLAFTRVRLELDASQGQVREVRDLLVYKMVTEHDLASFDRVEVVLKEIKYRHRESGSYKTLITNQIALCGELAEEVVVGLIDDEAAAEELGREVAVLLGLAYTGGGSNENASHN